MTNSRLIFDQLTTWGNPVQVSEVALSYLEHAAVAHTPKAVVLGVDFLNFLRDANKLKGSEDSDNDSNRIRLGSLNRDNSSWLRLRQNGLDALVSIVSISALSILSQPFVRRATRMRQIGRPRFSIQVPPSKA